MSFKVCFRCEKEYHGGRNSKYCIKCRIPCGRTSMQKKNGWVKHRKELFDKYDIKTNDVPKKKQRDGWEKTRDKLFEKYEVKINNETE